MCVQVGLIDCMVTKDGRNFENLLFSSKAKRQMQYIKYESMRMNTSIIGFGFTRHAPTSILKWQP